MANQIHRVVHRMLIPRGINDLLRQRAAKLSAQLRIKIFSRRIDNRQIQSGNHMLPARGAGIRHHHLRAIGFGNRRRAQTNRTGTDHQHLLTRRYRRPTYRMCADGIRLNQRRSLRVNALRIQQVGHRHGQVFAETAILVHANH